MGDTKIILSAIWIATMLTYLLGDVLRIFAGDFTPGEMDGGPVSGNILLLAGIMMLIPILMVLLSIYLPHQPNRWVNIVVAVVFFFSTRLVYLATLDSMTKFCFRFRW
jgi:hypothetical protein